MKRLLVILLLTGFGTTAPAQIKPQKYQKVLKVYLNQDYYEMHKVNIGLPGTRTGGGRLSLAASLFSSNGNFHELELSDFSLVHAFSWKENGAKHKLTSTALQIRYERAFRLVRKYLNDNIFLYAGPSVSTGFGATNCYTDSLEGLQYQIRNGNFILGITLRGSLAVTNRLSLETNIAIAGLTFHSNRIQKNNPNFPDNWNPYKHGNHWVENQVDARIGIAVKL